MNAHTHSLSTALYKRNAQQYKGRGNSLQYDPARYQYIIQSFTFTKYRLSPWETPNLYLAKFTTSANSVAQLVGTSARSPHDSPTRRSPCCTSSPVRSSFGTQTPKPCIPADMQSHLPTLGNCPNHVKHHVVPPAQLYDLRFQPSSPSHRRARCAHTRPPVCTPSPC